MRRRLNVVALLVMVTAGPVDAQIASEGTVRGVVHDAGGGVLARGRRYRDEPDRPRQAHQRQRVRRTVRDALQEYLGGSNQVGSPNFAYGYDGTFRGQNRQAARTAQLLVQFEF